MDLQPSSVNAPRHKPKREAGYTLPEMLIASGVIGVSFLAIFGAFSCGFKIIEFNREDTRATQILEEKTEMLRLYNWDQVNAAGFIPSTFTAGYCDSVTNLGGTTYSGTVSITTPTLSDANYSNDLRMVRIQLSWNSGGVSHSRNVTTLVSKYGVQNYVY